MRLRPECLGEDWAMLQVPRGAVVIPTYELTVPERAPPFALIRPLELKVRTGGPSASPH
jgi:hypothetical protein